MHRKTAPLNFTNHDKKEHTKTVEQGKSHKNDDASLSRVKKKGRKYKKRAKVELKEPHVTSTNAVEDGKEGKASSSSNWDEFVKVFCND